MAVPLLDMKDHTSSARLILLTLFLILHIAPLEAKTHLRITSTEQVKTSFDKWTTEKPLEQITNYSSPFANRATVELVLQLQALAAGGLDFDFEIIVTPNNARARIEVVQGNADITAETIWDSQIDSDASALLRTDPILREGEIEKGVYVLSSNHTILKVRSLAELQQFVGVAVNSWEVDVRTLRALKLKGLELPSKNESVFGMIAKGRADFTLLELSSEPDMGIELTGVRLIPVQGIILPLVGSRSWIVSKNSPDCKAIYDALSKGVKLMRAEGRITRAYKESGFVNQRAANWIRLH